MAERVGDRIRVVIDVVERGGSTYLINCRALDMPARPMLMLLGAHKVAAMRERPRVSQVRVLECVAEGRWALVDGLESR